MNRKTIQELVRFTRYFYSICCTTGFFDNKLFGYVELDREPEYKIVMEDIDNKVILWGNV